MEKTTDAPDTVAQLCNKADQYISKVPELMKSSSDHAKVNGLLTEMLAQLEGTRSDQPQLQPAKIPMPFSAFEEEDEEELIKFPVISQPDQQPKVLADVRPNQ